MAKRCAMMTIKSKLKLLSFKNLQIAYKLRARGLLCEIIELYKKQSTTAKNKREICLFTYSVRAKIVIVPTIAL